MCIDAREALTWWTLDPVAIATIAIPSLVYARGVRAGRGFRKREIAAFALGQLALFVALVSPVDRLSDILFSAHMTQHEILMIVAPPLVVLGRPFTAALWAMPPRWRSVFAHARVATAWRVVSAPVAAFVLHGVVVWLWHVPSLFEATLRNEAVHAVQHATFFGSAALFWFSIVRGRYGRLGYGLAVFFVFATALHTSILGVLFTLGATLWYPLYSARGAPFAVDPLEDQTLAGLVMWIPAGTVLLLAALALFAAWLGESARRVALAERRRSS